MAETKSTKLGTFYRHPFFFLGCYSRISSLCAFVIPSFHDIFMGSLVPFVFPLWISLHHLFTLLSLLLFLASVVITFPNFFFGQFGVPTRFSHANFLFSRCMYAQMGKKCFSCEGWDRAMDFMASIILLLLHCHQYIRPRFLTSLCGISSCLLVPAPSGGKIPTGIYIQVLFHLVMYSLFVCQLC